MLQSTHTETPFTSQSFPITLVCDGISSPANAGSMFRLADAFGVEEIIFCTIAPALKSSRLLRTARSTTHKISHRFEPDIVEFINSINKKESLLLGLEITSNSKPINKFSIKQNKQIYLFIGNEKDGLQESVIHLLHDCYHIPMYGQNSSMNVSHATAVALYELTSMIKNHNQSQ